MKIPEVLVTACLVTLSQTAAAQLAPETVADGCIARGQDAIAVYFQRLSDFADHEDAPWRPETEFKFIVDETGYTPESTMEDGRHITTVPSGFLCLLEVLVDLGAFTVPTTETDVLKQTPKFVANPDLDLQAAEYLAGLARVLTASKLGIAEARPQDRAYKRFAEWLGVPPDQAQAVRSTAMYRGNYSDVYASAIAFVVSHELAHHALGDTLPPTLSEDLDAFTRELRADLYANLLLSEAKVLPLSAALVLRFYVWIEWGVSTPYDGAGVECRYAAFIDYISPFAEAVMRKNGFSEDAIAAALAKLRDEGTGGKNDSCESYPQFVERIKDHWLTYPERLSPDSSR